MDGLDAVDLNDKDNSSRHSRVGTGLGVGNRSLKLRKQLWREPRGRKPTSYGSAHRSTISAKVSSSPTLPGNTMYGTLVCLEVGSSHRQMGTPGAAWPRIMARFMFNPFVAASDEVMPPYESVLVKTLEKAKQAAGLPLQ